MTKLLYLLGKGAHLLRTAEAPTKRFAAVLTKRMVLLLAGENFSSKESTESIFFPMTKLFQSKDVRALARSFALLLSSGLSSGQEDGGRERGTERETETETERIKGRDGGRERGSEERARVSE
eukprot:1599552-Rhodomonas_salina.2